MDTIYDLLEILYKHKELSGSDLHHLFVSENGGPNSKRNQLYKQLLSDDLNKKWIERKYETPSEDSDVIYFHYEITSKGIEVYEQYINALERKRKKKELLDKKEINEAKYWWLPHLISSLSVVVAIAGLYQGCTAKQEVRRLKIELQYKQVPNK